MTAFTAYSPVSAFTTVVLDIASSYRTRQEQEAMSELILHLLERGYQIFLGISTDAALLQGETFEHPDITFLRDSLPPHTALLEKYPALRAPSTLWVTDNARLQDWIRRQGLAFAFPAQRSVSFAPSLALDGYGGLAAMLDPTASTLRDVSSFLIGRKSEKRNGVLLVGIGGPPESGFQRFAVQLKRQLESDGAALVELLDLAAFLPASEDLSDTGQNGPWRDTAAGQWLVDTVLEPLTAGQRVYIQQRPAPAPKDFDAHFPLFLAEESIVLTLAEMLFVPPVRDFLDVSILLEVSKTETTRRLYEMPPGEAFDPKFTEQYMAGQGGRYREYLERHDVVRRSTLRLDANRPLAIVLHSRVDA